MAACGLQRTEWRLVWRYLALCILPFFTACSNKGLELPTGAVPLAGVVKITAEWLQAQPGRDVGEFGLRLLGANFEPLDDWAGLEITQPNAAEPCFEVKLARDAPDDIFLYVTYPNSEFAFSEAQLERGREDEYLCLAVAQKIERVVVVGLSRIGKHRGTAIVPGLVARLRFQHGAETVLREPSLVNEDKNSAPLLMALVDAPGGGPRLEWDERNIGDYDNSGQIGIADLAPVGIHFGKALNGNPAYQELLLVDGDENLHITIGDVTPIGRNFGRYIQGYVVYHATMADPQPGDFSAVAKPTINRADVWTAATPEERLRRLHFTYDPPCEEGPNYYYVCAYSADEDIESEGPASNIISRNFTPANQAPVWVDQAGLYSTAGIARGIRLKFGAAHDYDGDELVYSLLYIPSPGVPGDPGTMSLDLPAGVTAGDAPYYYNVSLNTPGMEYQLTIQARDAYHAPLAGNVLSGTVPASAGANPWAQHRNNNARTGWREAPALAMPLMSDWELNLGTGAYPDQQMSAVISAEDWVGAFNNDGQFLKVDGFNGQVITAYPAIPAPALLADHWHPVLDGDKLIIGVSTGIAVYDLSTSDVPAVYQSGSPVSASPLVDGDHVIFADEDGAVHALELAGGTELWKYQSSSHEPFTVSPCADESYFYAIDDAGNLLKLALADGQVVAEANHGIKPYGDALALDSNSGVLYFSSETDRLAAVNAGNLTLAWRMALEVNETIPCAPCLLFQHNPPLAVVGMTQLSMLEAPGVVIAINLETRSEQWRYYTNELEFPQNVSGINDLLLVNTSGGTYVIDADGRVRQDGIASSWQGEFAIDSTRAVSCPPLISVIPNPGNTPPEWIGTMGVEKVARSLNTMKVTWGEASDQQDQIVYYVVYYSEGAPPEFEPPYTHTTLFTDIPLGGEGITSFSSSHSYTITGLDPDKEYYAAVRAYDAPWDADPMLDTNTNYLKAEQAWNREELVLGQELPSGEVFFMRGLADDTGTIHLVWNDKDTGELTHLYGVTGDWRTESVDQGGLSAVAGFDITWDSADGNLAIGYATVSSAGVIKRTGSATWEIDDWSDAIPVTNPQVALTYITYGSDPYFAYTRFISGEFPVITEHYYARRWLSGSWLEYETLDELNYCGRDLDAAYSTLWTPWLPVIAMQRGTECVPGRLTPEKGALYFARALDGGGYDTTMIDGGENAPDSDCGKRVQLALGYRDHPCVAYLDLNASADEPLGQLKYAEHTEAGWEVSVVDEFLLDFQSGQMQYTYGELGFSGNAIAMLYRQSVADSVDEPHLAELHVYNHDSLASESGTIDSWIMHRINEPEWVFLRDREPCVLVHTPGVYHAFFVTCNDPELPKADKLVHYWTEELE